MGHSKRRVLITGPKIGGTFTGGIQTHIQNFLAAFADSGRVCVEYFPLTLGLYGRESWAAKLVRNVSLVIPYIDAGSKVEIIHLNSTFDMRSVVRDAFYASLAIWVLKKQVVIQFHGGQPADLNLFRWPIVKHALARVYRRAKAILVLSQKQGAEFEACFHAVKYTVVPNFIDTNVGVTSRGAKEFKTLIFLFMSRLNEAKGVREILIAADSLRRSGAGFKVIFCGDGPLKEWLQEQIKNQGLEGYIEYLGVVGGKQKEQVYIEANVLLLPTRHKEGFPYTILEAFKYSLPVISCPEGAIAEIVLDGVNGYLIESRDVKALETRMRGFCEQPEKAKRMGREGRRAVEENYSLDKMVGSFERIYGV